MASGMERVFDVLIRVRDDPKDVKRRCLRTNDYYKGRVTFGREMRETRWERVCFCMFVGSFSNEV
eukprot:1135750-Amorphochlora_amoeboformis.AAC.2